MLSFLLFFVAPPVALILFGILIAVVRPKLRSTVALVVSLGVTGHIGGLLLIPQLIASGYIFGDWVAFVGIGVGIAIGVTGGLIQRRWSTSRFTG
jgi:Na+/serine symporter